MVEAVKPDHLPIFPSHLNIVITNFKDPFLVHPMPELHHVPMRHGALRGEHQGMDKIILGQSRGGTSARIKC